MACEHARRVAVGEQPAAVGVDSRRVEHDDAIDVLGPQLDPVLDDDEGRARALGGRDDGIAHLDGARGVEVGGRLVEQQQSGAHRERSGQSEALLLPARERRGGVFAPERAEADLVERTIDPLPDLVSGDAEVLASECRIISHAGEDHLRVGVLQHEPGAAARAGGRDAVDSERAGLFAVAPVGIARRRRVAEHARERAQQSGLARPARAQQQHALARGDVEVERAHGGSPPPRVAPAPAARLDPRARGHAASGSSTTSRARASRPAANRSSAPVAASACTISHDSRPAMTIPDTTAETK